MILRLLVSNYLSFNQETEFNMLAGNVRRHSSHIKEFGGVKLLKSSVIYGANGSGKSSLLLSLYLIHNIISEGKIVDFKKSNKFKLDPNSIEKPTTIEVEFIIEKKAFSYRLSFHEDEIIEEWLYQLGLGKRENIMIFERKLGRNKKTKLYFNEKYQKNTKDRLLKELYEEDFLEKDVPFLSVGNKRFKELSAAFEWFDSYLIFIYPGVKFSALPSILSSDLEFNEFANSIIKHLGTGIDSLSVKHIDFDSYFGEENQFDKEQIYRKVIEGAVVSIGVNNDTVALLEDNKPVIKKVYSIHKDINLNDIEFELVEESDGSLRLFDFLPAIHLALTQPITILIDEIDQSIHVNLLKELVSKIQSKGDLVGQIIFTTHDSNLLDLDLFRQDEIWFSEKDQSGATHLYPLSDFDIRTEMDVAKGYLSGRFGAIPFLSNLKDLNWLTYAPEVK